MAQQLESGWLIPPAKDNETNIAISVGKGAKLSPEVRKALETLAKHVESKPQAAAMLGNRCPSITVTNCEVLVTCRGITMD